MKKRTRNGNCQKKRKGKGRLRAAHRDTDQGPKAAKNRTGETRERRRCGGRKTCGGRCPARRGRARGAGSQAQAEMRAEPRTPRGPETDTLERHTWAVSDGKDENATPRTGRGGQFTIWSRKPQGLGTDFVCGLKPQPLAVVVRVMSPVDIQELPRNLILSAGVTCECPTSLSHTRAHVDSSKLVNI